MNHRYIDQEVKMQKRYRLLFIITFIAFVAAVPLSMSSAKEPDVSKGYIGAATCQGCHETQHASYVKSIHSKKQVQGPEYKEACETCHGPGSQHVEKGGGRGVNIFDFGKKVDTNARSAKCLACHEETKHLAFWSLSRHKAEGVGCNDCHKVHSTEKKNLKEKQPELCFGCHKDIRAQVNKQSHHPIREGKVVCTDCHDPHGTFGAKMVKADSVNELCFKCHAEKRGPFRIEHQPVAENCLNCHNVHGSNHRSMLTSKPPQLCQECHGSGGHPGRAYTKDTTFKGSVPKIQMFGRACMNCHTNVHGSNADFLR